jgi:hypothetical protein
MTACRIKLVMARGENVSNAYIRSVKQVGQLCFARAGGGRYSVREKTLFFPNRPLQPDRSLAE